MAKYSDKSSRMNPSEATEKITDAAVPGFAGYAATRLASRIAYQTSQAKFPTGGRHVAVGTGLAVAGALLVFGKKLESIQKWQEPLFIGAGVAALQSAAQTYLPQYGWIVGDYKDASPNGETQGQQPALSGASEDELAALLEQNGLEEVPLNPSAMEKSVEDHDDFGDIDGLGDYNGVDDY